MEPSQAPHFPETLIIEAAAQAALILYCLIRKSFKENYKKFFVGKVDCRFQNNVFVGDKLIIKSYASKIMNVGGFSDIEIQVKNHKVSEILLFFSVKNE
jgi:3-hydroxymyristoyl/3-hydroxydecanoyl-(acyl carrier protein) dehydratase